MKNRGARGGQNRPAFVAWSLAISLLGLLCGHALAAEVIEVEGNRRIDAATVRSYFHATPDGYFDEAARDSALKSLLATGLFASATIERKGQRLVVHLTEAPVLDHVAFEGNKKIKDEKLNAVIESKPRGTLQRSV